MANLVYVASALLTSVFLFAVVTAALRLGDWQSYARGGGSTRGAMLRDLANEPVTWMVSFILLCLGFGGAAVLYVSDTPMVGTETVGAVLAVGAFAVIGGYLFIGSYDAARSRGRPSAQAVAEGSVLLGFLVVALIAVKLVTA